MDDNWFITGVSSGIGRALAQASLDRGARVAGSVRQSSDLETFEALAPGRAQGYLLDLSNAEAIETIVGKVLEGGPIHVVVNNAGQSVWGAVEETSVEEARALFDTNVFGPMAVMQAFLPYFRERRRGRFINLSSGCGLFPVPGCGVYSASKFALEALSEAVAIEASEFGIEVMIVEPGAVATRFISHSTMEASRPNEAYSKLTGGGKSMMEPWYEGACSAKDVADAILLAAEFHEMPLRLPVGAGMKESARARFSALAKAFD